MTMLADANLYIDGVIRPSANGNTFDVINPWTAKPCGKAADATEADVEEAIAAARRAFDETDWSVNHDLRYELVTKFVDEMFARKDELTLIARVEAGSAIGAASRAQIDGALNGGRDLLECFKKVTWEEDRGRKNDMGIESDRIVIHQPLGVVGAITPWNVPLYVNVGKVVAALLAGCTVILKPAPDTPRMGSIMGEIADKVGLPKGVFNVITSADPAMAGEMLTKDKRVDVISFTGSTVVGKRIMANGAESLKRIFLELGGKSVNIILEDAPDFQICCMMGMAVFHAGQGCAMPTRMLVPRSRYDEAIEALKISYGSFSQKWGEFDNPEHIMGPVISQKQYERVLEYIEIGKKEGAEVIAGGGPAKEKGDGYFIQPTCFANVTNDMRIAREEIFGPVLVVIPFDDDEDAIRIANDNDYALGGAVMSADKERATKIARRINAGAVSVNGGMSITGDLPFGGFKGSGMGREWGVEGIEEFLDTKAIAFKAE
ncbi:aldehyde dehydrogenase family protein [Spongiibacter nanhainus]|uniref:Aldehyde dehydrogenase family protein n=1 Tax=Spongiibacter nanhainus TaxID=2794344 RepID=A0A7T4QYT7_9GAMM|nr:aldehyde dehydrogenase family protein [Spongiibacter nanhainus]QQD17206.1 aldehyde dehydrogenase family protein [Spongiibacter nanhainus]